MPIYTAKVKDHSGKVFTEKVEAASPEQAHGILKNRYQAIGKINKSAFDLESFLGYGNR